MTKSPAQSENPGNTLPPDLREFLVATIADILVRDYEQSQRLVDPTGAEGSLPNRNEVGQIVPFPPMGPKS